MARDETSAEDIKKGTFFDDESCIVRQGTEPKLLIATAAGLEAYVSPAMRLHDRPSKFKSGLQFPNEENTFLGESSVQVVGSR